jgi:hypothetical protein
MFCFILQCKIVKRSFEYVQKILDNLKENNTLEEDIIFAMGCEPSFRDQDNANLLLFYSNFDGSSNMLIKFILTKNNAGDFILRTKEITYNQEKKNLERLTKDQYKAIYSEIQQTCKIESPKYEDINKETQGNNIINFNEYQHKFRFADLYLTLQDLQCVDILMRDSRFSKYSQDRLRMIKFFIILKLLINNKEQEASFFEGAMKHVTKDLKMKPEDFKVFTVNSLFMFFCTTKFFLHQAKAMKLNPFSKFKNYENLETFENKNSLFITTYEIFHPDGTFKIYHNIKQQNLPNVLLPYIVKKTPLKQLITLPDGTQVMFHRITRMYYSDQINEIQIINIPTQDKENVESITKSFLTNKKILTELKRIYPNLEHQIRHISQNSTNPEDIDILNALEHYRGRLIFEQDEKIMVLLHLGTVSKNAKLEKQQIKDHSHDLFVLLQIALRQFGVNIIFR